MILEKFPATFHLWTGLTDIKEEGTWRWVNDEVAVRSDEGWATHEPNGNRNENCASIHHTESQDQYLHDISCDGLNHGLCEKND